METVFVNLDARRITVYGDELDQNACVGQGTVCYTVLPRRKAPHQTGKVLDFEACRRALEPATQAAAQEEAPRAGEGEDPKPRRRPDLALAADLLASAGILAVVAAVAVSLA